MQTHTCIKCQNKYKSKEADADFCPSCENAKRSIAEQFERIHGAVRAGSVERSIDRYDSLPKVNGYPRAAEIL